MEEERKNRNSGVLQPNTTQIPHIIIREWMPLLKDVELRVLLVVADQTLGWAADDQTGRRKERDWISLSQLMKKTGRGSKAVPSAIKVLIEKYGIVEAVDAHGGLLDTAEKRRRNFGKIYYRLRLSSPSVRKNDERAPDSNHRSYFLRNDKSTNYKRNRKTKYPLTPTERGDVDKSKRPVIANPRALGTNPRMLAKKAKAAERKAWDDAVSSCRLGCRDGVILRHDAAAYCACVLPIIRARNKANEEFRTTPAPPD